MGSDALRLAPVGGSANLLWLCSETSALMSVFPQKNGTEQCFRLAATGDLLLSQSFPKRRRFIFTKRGIILIEVVFCFRIQRVFVDGKLAAIVIGIVIRLDVWQGIAHSL
jgi:hypothetical protein